MNFQECMSGISKAKLNNIGCQSIFDYLSSPSTVNNMIIFSNVGLPALSGIAEHLESSYANDPDFPLSSHHNRKHVGKMVKYILDFYGYTPVGGGLEDRAYLRNFSNANHFKTCSIYSMTKAPTLKLTITSN